MNQKTKRVVRFLSSLVFGVSVLSGCGDDEKDQLREQLEELRNEVQDLKQLKYDLSALQSDVNNVKGKLSLPQSTEVAIKQVFFRSDGSYLDDPFLGQNEASLLMLAYGDFQSPPCRQFFTETLPLLKKDFVDTGKVKLVYRDFPLPNHPQAVAASTFANCAGEQGLYWQAFELLLTNQQVVDSGDFSGLAKSLDKADTRKFEKCRVSTRYTKEIERDLAEARKLGAKGAPGFFIGKAAGKDVFDGVLIRGAQPYGVFQAEIEKLLEPTKQ